MKKFVLSFGVITLLLSLCSLALPTTTRAAANISESFMNSTAPGWILEGATLTGTSAQDGEGKGWLRLTDNTQGQAGSAIYNTAFSSADGIRVQFQYASYGGTGADGIGFYLLDGSVANPAHGALGGALGYGKLNSTPGLTKGYVGIGLDEFGNFSSSLIGACNPSCPGLSPQTVTVRGSGDGTTGYNYLTQAKVSKKIDNVSRSKPRTVRITIVDQKITVEIDFNDDNGFKTIIDQYDLKNAPGQTALPATFKMGFSAATGNQTNYHEIRGLTVNGANPTTTTLTSSTTSITVHQSVTLTAKVTSTFSGVLDGKVTFLDGSDIIGEGTLDGTGTATLTTDMLKAGMRKITARYEGNSVFGLSTSSIVTITVTGTATTTTITSTSTTVNVGQAVTFQATVSGAGGPPTGKVTFYDGSDKIGNDTLDATGNATLTISSLSAGSHTISAKYEGDSTFESSTSTSSILVTVTGGSSSSTTITLTSSTTSSQTGTSIVFKVSVSGSGSTPKGTITFYDNGTQIGTATLDSSGNASFAISSLKTGNHTIKATYSDTNGSISSSLNITVTGSTTTTTTFTSTVTNQRATFDLTVSGSGGTPTGKVTFRDNGIIIGTVDLNVNGKATFTTDTLVTGSHTITAQYEGDATFTSSTSTITLVVGSTSTATITLTSSSSTTLVGQSATFTMTIVSTSGIPTGTVTFLDGTTVIGTATLDATGKATFTTSNLTEGIHIITAQYSGDATFGPGTSPQLTLIVDPTTGRPSDLSVSQTYTITRIREATFTIIARNNGPSAANNAVVMNVPFPTPAPGTNWTWTCVAENGASCTESGVGNINDTLTSFPSGGMVTYTVQGSLDNWSNWKNTVKITAPAAISESDVSNNSATVGRYQVLLPQMTRR